MPAPVARPGFDPGPWRQELRAFLVKMGAGDELDDLIQEVFLRSVRRPPSGAPRAYLYRVALNLLRDRSRHLGRTERALQGLARIERPAVTCPAETIAARDLVERAWRIIARLPDQQRAALILRIDRQFTYRESASMLGCSEATVRQHFYLGMKALRAVLAGGGDE
ncbi:MAG: sigma-70 family RNA polymerase sigma factor [Planctomycetota bacterium]